MTCYSIEVRAYEGVGLNDVHPQAGSMCRAALQGSYEERLASYLAQQVCIKL